MEGQVLGVIRATVPLSVVMLPPEVPPTLESLGTGRDSSFGRPASGRAFHLPGPEAGLHHMQRYRSPVWTTAHGREE